jgi:hypothetical protein
MQIRQVKKKLRKLLTVLLKNRARKKNKKIGFTAFILLLLLVQKQAG